jgi:hypothetical protein
VESKLRGQQDDLTRRQAVLWIRIRIHYFKWIRIWIRKRILIPIRIQDFDDQKFKKNAADFKNLLIDQKLQFTNPRLSYRTSKLQKMPSALQKIKFLIFFYFSRSFLSSWIRIQSGSGPQNCHQVLDKEALQTENNMYTKYFNQKIGMGTECQWSSTVWCLCVQYILSRIPAHFPWCLGNLG